MTTANMDQLLQQITKIIASPHTALTEHDTHRALSVFFALDEYLLDNVAEYCGDTGFGEIDFGYYASGILEELEAK